MGNRGHLSPSCHRRVVCSCCAGDKCTPSISMWYPCGFFICLCFPLLDSVVGGEPHGRNFLFRLMEINPFNLVDDPSASSLDSPLITPTKVPSRTVSTTGASTPTTNIDYTSFPLTIPTTTQVCETNTSTATTNEHITTSSLSISNNNSLHPNTHNPPTVSALNTSASTTSVVTIQPFVPKLGRKKTKFIPSRLSLSDMFSPSNWPRYFLIDLGEDNDYTLDNMLRKSVGPTYITYLPTNQRLIEVTTEEQSNILQGWVHSPPPDYKIAEHPELNSVTGTVAIPDNIHSGSVPFVDSAALNQENLADSPTPVLRVVTYVLRDRTDSSRCTRIAKITFKGSDLPTHIRLAGRRLPVRQYVCRPRQCTKCWKFGHQAKNCRAPNSICSDCGSTTHTAVSCSNITISCINCGGRHRASSPRCSHFTYQQYILNFRLPRGLFTFSCSCTP